LTGLCNAGHSIDHRAVSERDDYVDRVNRAIDHVLANLREPLRLDDVAKVACFSPFHFHRIFQLLTGETLHAFVKRARLERALALLTHGDVPLTRVALECGFSSSSDFSRSFKQQYGVAPRAFDVERFRAERRREFEAAVTPAGRHGLLARLPTGENPDRFTVTLREVPARRIAYLRVQNSYAGDGVVRAIERLVAWAEARDLADGQWLGYSWDDPEIVPLEKCRYDVGLEVPERTAAQDGVSMLDLPPLVMACVPIRGGVDLELRALDWIYGTWFPASGYVPAHQPSFEAWNGRPFADGFELFDIRIEIAITKL
jgi:AraC family transcriptional regulator